MSIKISNSQKKEFIRWFLNHYQLKRRESVWILNYIISHDNLLSKLHFVDDITGCARACKMSTHCSEEVAFRFFKGSVMTTDAEKAFHDIRLNRDKELYLQLDFPSNITCDKYVAVLEQNPFLPIDHIEDNTFSGEVDKFISSIEKKHRRSKLMKEIDKALDNKDEKLFMSLSSVYKEL